MEPDQWWSWVLGAIGVVGFILAGKKVWWSWYVNIGNQFIWTAYSFATQQWGFLAVTLFYFVVFSRNAYLWTKDHREQYQVLSPKYDQRTIDAFDDHRRIVEGEFEDYQTDTKFHASTIGMDRRDLLQRLWHSEQYRSNSVNAELKVTCDAAPVQIEGTAFGKIIYFRERFGHWTFGYGDTIEEAQDVVVSGEGEEFMPVVDALRLTRALIDVYLVPYSGE